jgi:predicted hotdog family 3-hydroxylacyl-ACP dehydratase
MIVMVCMVRQSSLSFNMGPYALLLGVLAQAIRSVWSGVLGHSQNHPPLRFPFLLLRELNSL